jgi:protein-S-isoprenylcysteine O-methyltransferase Ste14
MKISRYQKLFGVGQISALIGLIILGILWLLDRSMGHIGIFHRPTSARIISSILIAIWICWHAWCMKTISQWWRNDKLCTTGPYRFVRHPIYAGGLWLGSLGISFLFNSWMMLLQPVIFFPILTLLVQKEEKMMLGIFGEEYKSYADKTGRLFPRLLG